jgi:DNA-directed RNA polymerase subunit beta
MVAFMPWQGYNYEDAIVISERIVRDDVFTSVHVDEYSLEVRDTKRGVEEFTSDIPNVSEEATRNLDENGLIRIGADVKPGDILIGKITPKGESDPSPEEKLLRAIFGDNAGDVKDASLKASPSLSGIVIDKKLFSRVAKGKKGKATKTLLDQIDEKFEKDVAALRTKLEDKLFTLIAGKTSQGVKDYYGTEVIAKGVKFTLKQLQELDYLTVNPSKWTTDKDKNDMVFKVINNYIMKYKEAEAVSRRERYNVTIGDELPAGNIQLLKFILLKKGSFRLVNKWPDATGTKGLFRVWYVLRICHFWPNGTRLIL